MCFWPLGQECCERGSKSTILSMVSFLLSCIGHDYIPNVVLPYCWPSCFIFVCIGSFVLQNAMKDTCCLGGVPTSNEQWIKLFEYHVELNKAVNEGREETDKSRVLCNDCKNYFAFGKRMSK